MSAAGFITAPKSKVFFRIEVRSVEFLLQQRNGSSTSVDSTIGFHFVLNFDNYRTVTSSTKPKSQLPCWVSAEETKVFLYETMHPHLLVAKTCSIELFDGDVFCGHADVDLLTLATGPAQISLTLYDGDRSVGRVNLVLTVNEICQTWATLKKLTLKHFRGPLANVTLDSLSVVVKKRASDDAVPRANAVVHRDAHEVSFIVDDHLFSMDSESMRSQAGFLIELHDNECLVGRCSLVFQDFIVSSLSPSHLFILPQRSVTSPSGIFSPASLRLAPHDQNNDNRSSTSQLKEFDDLHPDSSEMRVSPPPVNGGKNVSEREFSFDCQVTSAEGAHGLDVATAEGIIRLDRTVTFAQMPEGVTIDGRVWGKPIPGFVRPPFLVENE